MRSRLIRGRVNITKARYMRILRRALRWTIMTTPMMRRSIIRGSRCRHLRRTIRCPLRRKRSTRWNRAIQAHTTVLRSHQVDQLRSKIAISSVWIRSCVSASSRNMTSSLLSVKEVTDVWQKQSASVLVEKWHWKSCNNSHRPSMKSSNCWERSTFSGGLMK